MSYSSSYFPPWRGLKSHIWSPLSPTSRSCPLISHYGLYLVCPFIDIVFKCSPVLSSPVQSLMLVPAFVPANKVPCKALCLHLGCVSSCWRDKYVQNSAAEALTHTKHSAYITPVLFKLHCSVHTLRSGVSNLQLTSRVWLFQHESAALIRTTDAFAFSCVNILW